MQSFLKQDIVYFLTNVLMAFDSNYQEESGQQRENLQQSILDQSRQ